MRGGDFLVVQWLRLHASTAGGTGSIPGWGTKIPHATWHGPEKKKKKRKILVKSAVWHWRKSMGFENKFEI